jgi:hypothetical protein
MVEVFPEIIQAALSQSRRPKIRPRFNVGYIKSGHLPRSVNRLVLELTSGNQLGNWRGGMEPSTRWMSTAGDNFAKLGSRTMVKNQRSKNRALVELAYGPSIYGPHRWWHNLLLNRKTFSKP